MDLPKAYQEAKDFQHIRRHGWHPEWYLWKEGDRLDFYGPTGYPWQTEILCQDWEILKEC